MADFQVRERLAGLVGRERGVSHALEIGNTQLCPRVGYLLADNNPHPVRPGRQVQHRRDVGDPGAITFNTVTVMGTGPPLVGGSWGNTFSIAGVNPKPTE